MTLPIGDGYGSIGSCGQGQVIATETASAADFTFNPWTRGISVSTAGSLAMTLGWETESAAYPLPAGWHPLRVKAIYSTGSTAQGVCVFW